MKTTFSGFRELDEALGQLTKSAAKGVLRRVGIKALEPVAEAMRAHAPDDPETGGYDLRNSITVGTKLSPRQAKMQRRAIRSGDAEKYFVEVYAGPGPLPHAHLQEFGTVNHPPQPFVRLAWDSEQGKVLKIVKDDLGDEITKTAKRLARRAAAKAV